MRMRVFVTGILGLTGLLAGCASNQPLTLKAGAKWPDKVESVYVEKVGAAQGVQVDQIRLETFRGLVKSKVDGVIAPASLDLLSGQPSITLTCTVTKYEPGNPIARLMFAGAGSAHFDVEYSLNNPSDFPLATGKVRKLWAWGGVVGASKGIEDMVSEAAAEIGEELRRFRMQMLDGGSGSKTRPDVLRAGGTAP